MAAHPGSICTDQHAGQQHQPPGTSAACRRKIWSAEQHDRRHKRRRAQKPGATPPPRDPPHVRPSTCFPSPGLEDADRRQEPRCSRARRCDLCRIDPIRSPHRPVSFRDQRPGGNHQKNSYSPGSRIQMAGGGHAGQLFPCAIACYRIPPRLPFVHQLNRGSVLHLKPARLDSRISKNPMWTRRPFSRAGAEGAERSRPTKRPLSSQ